MSVRPIFQRDNFFNATATIHIPRILGPPHDYCIIQILCYSTTTSTDIEREISSHLFVQTHSISIILNPYPPEPTTIAYIVVVLKTLEESKVHHHRDGMKSSPEAVLLQRAGN